MKILPRQRCLTLTLIAVALFTAPVTRAADPLQSWNDSAPKKAVTAFVERITKPGGADFVLPAERIPVFHSDVSLVGFRYNLVGKFLATFKGFPPGQKAGSFTLDQVMEQLKSSAVQETF
ncbi:hypothetical protein [Petrachloros mirabilis]